MADVLHRQTLEHRTSVNTPEYAPADWLINPDLSAVETVPRKYWAVDGDSVVEMSAPEKALVDAAELVEAMQARIVAMIEEARTPLRQAGYDELTMLSATRKLLAAQLADDAETVAVLQPLADVSDLLEQRFHAARLAVLQCTSVEQVAAVAVDLAGVAVPMIDIAELA